MEQLYAHHSNYTPRYIPTQPPIVSGSEIRNTRTGVATRQSRTANRSALSPSPSSVQGKERNRTDYTGILPERASLAVPFVPYQSTNPERYSSHRGFSRGTLYPDLDLPLCGPQNTDTIKNDQTNLMGLDFALTELGLYLDTHPDDRDAYEVFQSYAKQAKEARIAYEQKHGSLTLSSNTDGDTWGWLCDPWPWDFCQEV